MTTLFSFINILAKFLKYALIIIVGLFFALVILVAAYYRDFKTVYTSGLQGKTQLTEAITQVQNQDWANALVNAQAADLSFNTALDKLGNIKNNFIFKHVPVLQSQINDLEYLFKTTEILSRSLENSIPLVAELNKIRSGAAGGSFVNLTDTEKAHFLQLIYESEPELKGLAANLDLALFNINRIHRYGILAPLYGQISEYKTQLQTAADLVAKLPALTKLLPALGGYPQGSEFLILLQNNDELRPTGGFIGVIGLATTKNGEIITLSTDDSYHLDMPAVGKWQLEPPVPIQKYLGVENWYLRDANWVPDWPLAAQKINQIYTGESLATGQAAPNFTGTIAINPDFISDLLRLVGPINVKGEDYTADNFQELLQYNVEVAYKDRNISSWDRKDIINEMLAELKTRLFNLPTKDWGGLIKIIENNIAAKNIQLYFADANLESLVKDLGADGEVRPAPSDYLMVVDANLAAFKSDAVMKKTIDYSLLQRSGIAAATLALNYRHEGDFNWRTTRYRSYTRIYVPFGSRLINFSGIDQDTADWSTLDDPILNKTIFGFFFTVEPGTEREIMINYSLPDSINQQITNNTYELLVQKQSGRRTQSLKVNISPQNGNSKNWSSDLNTDKIFK
ncbi:MAG: DUF4012 domain-containing protein [Patescibacteria group bacterium]